MRMFLWGGEQRRPEGRGDKGASVHACISSPVMIAPGPGMREPVSTDRFRGDTVIGAAAPRPREVPDSDYDNCKRNKPAHAALRVSKTGSARRRARLRLEPHKREGEQETCVENPFS